MAVNGSDLAIGQVWQVRGGGRVAIVGRSADLTYPWRIDNGVTITDAGRANIRHKDETDLISFDGWSTEVAGPTQVSDINTPESRTNPKDAAGDKKLPLWLLSPIAKAQWSICQFVGLLKYGAWNWRIAGVRSSVYLSAMGRHLDAYLSGEELDPKDGTPHLGHIMACAAILIDAKAAGKLIDDRPPSVDLRDAYATAEAQMAILKVQYADMAPRHYTIADTEPVV